MTATTTVILPKFAGNYPARLTLPIAADTLIIKGTQVAKDAAGRAVMSTDGDGFPVMGKASATFDNRTGSEAGGAAGALDAEIECGIFGRKIDGTTPQPGDIVFAVDNQTVSLDPDGGARGKAGYVHEVQGTIAYVYQAPEAVISAADVDLAVVEADLARENAHFDIPISAFRIYSSGLVAGAWVDGGDDGIDSTAESHGLRWNPGSTVAFAASLNLPPDIAAGSPITIHLLGCRVGADDATAAITCGVFFRVPGAAFNADADAGGDSSAFDGATTVVTEETLVVAAGDVPDAAPASMLLTVVPTAALNADDLILHGVRCTYTREAQGS